MHVVCIWDILFQQRAHVELKQPEHTWGKRVHLLRCRIVLERHRRGLLPAVRGGQVLQRAGLHLLQPVPKQHMVLPLDESCLLHVQRWLLRPAHEDCSLLLIPARVVLERHIRRDGRPDVAGEHADSACGRAVGGLGGGAVLEPVLCCAQLHAGFWKALCVRLVLFG